MLLLETQMEKNTGDELKLRHKMLKKGKRKMVRQNVNNSFISSSGRVLKNKLQ